MQQFKTITDVLCSDLSFLSDGYKEKTKTDRVLKSTKIEQAIYDELYCDSENLSAYESVGSKKLNTFSSLINDVFQSVYGLSPKFLDDKEISALAGKFNKSILDDLMSDDNYSAIKRVCEGKELPALGATEEFTDNILKKLDSLMQKATGGNGKLDALRKLQEDRQRLIEQLTDLLKEREQTPESDCEALDKKIVQTANRMQAKQEQCEMYGNLIEASMKKNSGEIKAIVASAAKSALEKANDTQNAILSWGSEGSEMQKNAVNAEILKRISKSDKLRYIAKLLGRFKTILNSKRLAGHTYGRGETYDLEYGNKISKALTSELSMIASPELAPLFIRKYQNKTIKQYRKREPEYKGKGDVIVCLDESGSTFGENNAYGMAIAMVLLDICRVNNANFTLVHFSTKTRVDYFPKSEKATHEKIMDCAESFLGGGTDFEKPLREVFALTSTGKLKNPDVVFITDGICSLSDDFLKVFSEYKADTGAKLTGILLDKGNCFEFSLQKFADKVYRTSELLEETIVEKIIDERI